MKFTETKYHPHSGDLILRVLDCIVTISFFAYLVLCGCFGNVCLYILYFILFVLFFVLFRLCIFIVCFVCTSARTTATE